jgi:hypothetical protein
MALIVDIQTGTVLDSRNCYVVIGEDLNETDEHLLENGSDHEIANVAILNGLPLEPRAMERVLYGLHSVGYEPSALRAQASVMLDDYADYELTVSRDHLQWVATQASDAELGILGSMCAEDDQSWVNYEKVFIHALTDLKTTAPF